MKLSKTELESIEMISAIAGLEKNTIKNVFQSLIISVIQAFYTESNIVSIPFFGDVTFEYSDKLNENGVNETCLKISIEPSEFLIEELKSVLNGDVTSSKKFIQKCILIELQNKLEVGDDDLDI